MTEDSLRFGTTETSWTPLDEHMSVKGRLYGVMDIQNARTEQKVSEMRADEGDLLRELLGQACSPRDLDMLSITTEVASSTGGVQEKACGRHFRPQSAPNLEARFIASVRGACGAAGIRMAVIPASRRNRIPNGGR